MEESDKEIIGMLIVLALFMSGLQWLFVRFTHWSVALIVTAAVSFIITFFYVTLSHATPNGGSNGPELSDFIMPILTILSILLCTLWLVCYLTGVQMPNKIILASIGLFTVLGCGRYIYQYIENITVYSELFSSCYIEIPNERSSTITLESVCLKSTSSSLAEYLRPDSNERSVFIPRNTDKIFFHYYKNESYIEEEFPFDYKLCQEKEGTQLGLVFWVQQKSILPIKLILRPENKIDLYIDDRFITHYLLDTKKQ